MCLLAGFVLISCCCFWAKILARDSQQKQRGAMLWLNQQRAITFDAYFFWILKACFFFECRTLISNSTNSVYCIHVMYIDVFFFLAKKGYPKHLFLPCRIQDRIDGLTRGEFPEQKRTLLEGIVFRDQTSRIHTGHRR